MEFYFDSFYLEGKTLICNIIMGIIVALIFLHFIIGYKEAKKSKEDLQ